MKTQIEMLELLTHIFAIKELLESENKPHNDEFIKTLIIRADTINYVLYNNSKKNED